MTPTVNGPVPVRSLRSLVRSARVVAANVRQGELWVTSVRVSKQAMLRQTARLSEIAVSVSGDTVFIG